MITVIPISKKEHIIQLFKIQDAYLDYGVDDPDKLAINVQEPFYHIVFLLDKTPVGFAHYHKVSSEIAEIHFCVYRTHRDLSMDIANEGFSYLKRKGFKQLITFTPKHLRHVKLFALKCGFKPVPGIETMTEKKL